MEGLATESEEYNDIHYEPFQDNIELREESEDDRIYDIFSNKYDQDTSETEYRQINDGLSLFGPSLKLAYNKTNNPIVYVMTAEADETKPVYVVALIEKGHIGKGESTSQNKRVKDLAKIIRSRGIIKNNEALDQCGHIISRNLGGKMEYGNLIPQGKTSNISQYVNAERIITEYLNDKTKNNPRAIVQAGLIYGDDNYPYRPTKFYYSYVLFCDEDDERKNQNNNKTNLQIKIKLKTGLPVTIMVESGEVSKARTRISNNRIAKVAKKVAFWCQIAAAIVVLITPAPVPVPVPVPVGGPIPCPAPLHTVPASNPMPDTCLNILPLVHREIFFEEIKQVVLVAAAC